jgi:hypothetical protein
MTGLGFNVSAPTAYSASAAQAMAIEGGEHASSAASTGASSSSSSSSMAGRWMDSVTRMGTRMFGADVGETVLQHMAENKVLPPVPKVDFKAPVLMPFHAAVQRNISWDKLLGINTQPLTPTAQAMARQSPQHYAHYVRNRFTAPRITVAEAGGLRNTVKQLALNNVKGITTALEKGKYLLAGSSALAMGLFGVGVGHETMQAYQQAKAQSNNPLAIAANTVVGGAKALLKSGVAWEVGTLGMLLGGTLAGPLGVIGAKAIGIMAGGAASVVSKALMDKADDMLSGKPKPTELDTA